MLLMNIFIQQCLKCLASSSKDDIFSRNRDESSIWVVANQASPTYRILKEKGILRPSHHKKPCLALILSFRFYFYKIPLSLSKLYFWCQLLRLHLTRSAGLQKPCPQVLSFPQSHFKINEHMHKKKILRNPKENKTKKTKLKSVQTKSQNYLGLSNFKL